MRTGPDQTRRRKGRIEADSGSIKRLARFFDLVNTIGAKEPNYFSFVKCFLVGFDHTSIPRFSVKCGGINLRHARKKGGFMADDNRDINADTDTEKKDRSYSADADDDRTM